MLKKQINWRKYENYTRQILNNDRIQKYLEEYFNLYDLKIKPKKKLPGKKTKTKWEVDAYGYDIDNHLVLIECKHYETRYVVQNTIAAFAYIIKDVEAQRGIVVTTLGLQSGAIKVAKTENIGLLKLDYNSTDNNFFIRFISNETQPSKAIAAFTDQLNGVSGIDGKMIVTQYPLDEAQKRLQQRTGRTQFSPDEINEEMENILKEISERL
ncbi:restriction endonuclease [Nostoc sp. CENA67]|uniref:Restriction endonuclease n=1 Tax=Amazonocrinis nigriterrae CENA67 TaxID=2794033 RepID=A0A8J7L9Y6_9NOST|nr:restriction endonuclease [Amazonocrinis nigriterrae]MBH8561996.1 restriction endonuclease [Amazonocrinis nigriterrae CENA67]